MRRTPYAAALLALVLPLSACGSGSAGSSDAEPRPDAGATTAADPWNPCSGVTAAPVARALGEAVVETSGTAEQPRCAFLPKRRHGPVLSVTYLWFDGGLDRAWRQMDVADGVTTRPRIAGADAARLVVNAQRKGLAVTGFVQDGGLIQAVNAVALPPYDTRAVTAATTTLLTRLSAAAPTSEQQAAG